MMLKRNKKIVCLTVKILHVNKSQFLQFQKPSVSVSPVIPCDQQTAAGTSALTSNRFSRIVSRTLSNS